MISPFRRHQQRVLAQTAARVTGNTAAAAAPSAPAPDGPAGQEYAAQRVLLHDNLRTLSDISSHEARQPKKREFAAAFAPWIEGVLEADAPVQDEVLVTNLIWAIDYRDIDYALRLGRFAIKHGLQMPGSYNRTLACFLAEDIAEAALKDPASVRHDQLTEVGALTAEADMPDPARAKLMKALGRSWAERARAFDPAADSAPAGGARAYAEEALANLRRALSLDPASGVKTEIKSLEKLVSAGDAPPAAPAPHAPKPRANTPPKKKATTMKKTQPKAERSTAKPSTAPVPGTLNTPPAGETDAEKVARAEANPGTLPSPPEGEPDAADKVARAAQDNTASPAGED